METAYHHTSVLDPPITRFRNCRLYKRHNIIFEDLWVRNGIILDPEKLFFDEKRHADQEIDCCNAIISPGFIDLQINGGMGVDFSQPTNNICESIEVVAQEILSHGVTSFCPTLVTSPPDIYKQVLPGIKKCHGSRNGAGVLGVHLEGPFISKQKKGAHPEQYITSFQDGFQSVVKMYGSLDDVSILTLAPEIPDSDTIIKELSSKGIVVSLGHSIATLPQGEEAVKNGARFITHLFNAMLSFHHRDPGLVGLLTSIRLDENPVFFGLIADGIHTHPAAIRIAHKTNQEGLVLVTDAIAAMGLGVGKHKIGQMDIEIINHKKAVIAGTDTLCGSITTMASCVQHYMKQAACSKVEALEAATLHPAQVLKITDKKGTLEYGSDADIVMLDDDLNLLSTYIAGEIVWNSHPHIWAKRQKISHVELHNS